MSIPKDFQDLLPPRVSHQGETDDRCEMLWVYDPQEDTVHVEKGETDHPAHFPTFDTMAQHVNHPDRLNGYAVPIKGGWRIMDEFGKKIEDPHMLKLIRDALRGVHPAPPLPHIRYHGDPNRHH